MPDQLLWEQKVFSLLSTGELHQIICARQAVFIVEQELICEDADAYDFNAIHLTGRETSSGEILAYARIHAPGQKYAEAAIGRVLVAKQGRNRGLGKLLMEECLDFCGKEYSGTAIRLSAQAQTIGFYEKLGFVAEGDRYLDAGIPHVDMVFTF